MNLEMLVAARRSFRARRALDGMSFALWGTWGAEEGARSSGRCGFQRGCGSGFEPLVWGSVGSGRDVVRVLGNLGRRSGCDSRKRLAGLVRERGAVVNLEMVVAARRSFGARRALDGMSFELWGTWGAEEGAISSGRCGFQRGVDALFFGSVGSGRGVVRALRNLGRRRGGHPRTRSVGAVRQRCAALNADVAADLCRSFGAMWEVVGLSFELWGNWGAEEGALIERGVRL